MQYAKYGYHRDIVGLKMLQSYILDKYKTVLYWNFFMLLLSVYAFRKHYNSTEYWVSIGLQSRYNNLYLFKVMVSIF